MIHSSLLSLFFFNDTATTEIYTLSLHDALPISDVPYGALRLLRGAFPGHEQAQLRPALRPARSSTPRPPGEDRKSTRLNSSHSQISYAVFCLKKKKEPPRTPCLLKTHVLDQKIS